MANDILTTLFAALVSVGTAILFRFLTERAGNVLRKILGRPPVEPKQEEYSARLHRLTESLRQSSAEVDSVLTELSVVARERQEAAERLESQLSQLQQREQTLQERVRALEQVPLPVAEYFASLTSAGEKRNARRDYMLFGAGVLVSTVISVIFFLLQPS